MRRVLGLAAVALLVGGCAMPTVPTWVPLLGKTKKPPSAKTVKAAPAPPPAPAPVEVKTTKPVVDDDSVADRVLAVVNNDAITLSEVQESVALYKQERRGQVTESDDELVKQFLGRLIDSRLELQEADREKITVDDSEVDEEMLDRAKKFNVSTKEEFEKLLKEQGLSIDAIRKRLRDSLRVSKVVRRKVMLRVSVTDEEITKYLDENRAKLETGLAYRARHILIQPESDTDSGWESAHITVEMVRKQIEDGADFAELAKKYSKDASAKDGGDLGVLHRGELAQDIESQILALQPGQLSQPYRSPLGWHLFKLESKETLDGDGLQRVRQQIREILLRQKYEARQDAWLKEVKQRAVIEIRM